VVITTLPADRLHANEYNPNRMTEAEYAELVAEVRHLKRLPKPVVVRPDGDGYTIVDGEHGWRAANDVGLSEVPCEVIDADDFEAMRQTYKRNQHGTHDPLLLGRMFRRMMESRSLSARALAEEITVSEGTVRNAVMYAEAWEVRNRYAPNESERKISDLSVRQVRTYLKLGGRLADLWLDAGADISLTQLKRPRQWVGEWDHWQENAWLDYLRGLVGTGLFEFVGRVYSSSGFEDAVKKVQAWKNWESRWLQCGVDRDEFRGYVRHFYKGVFWVRDEGMMDDVLAEILDIEAGPPAWLLTAEEFASVLSGTGKREEESHRDFMRRLSLAVSEKTGKPPRETKRHVQDCLLERRLEGAPEYIRAAKLRHPWAKLALWQANGPEEAKREIATLTYLPCQEGGKESGNTQDAFERCVAELIRKWAIRRDIDAEWDARSQERLAATVAGTFGIYDPQRDAAAIVALAGKLATLTKDELVYLTDHIRRVEFFRAFRGESRGQSRPAEANGSGEVVGECYDADSVSLDANDQEGVAE
jgi:ParB/RepB/Spo0J family partition protein